MEISIAVAAGVTLRAACTARDFGGRAGGAAILSKQTEGETLRPAILIVLAVLIAALWAFDGYEYDGHYRAAAWDYTKQEAAKVGHQIEDIVGSHK